MGITDEILLSIVVPAYNREGELRHNLSCLARQRGIGEAPIEVVICDDASSSDIRGLVREFEGVIPNLRYHRNPENIGLERNLIASAKQASGTFVWIFGDDDFFDADDGLERVLAQVRKDEYDVIVLNRSRRRFRDLAPITPDWMGLSGQHDREFPRLRDFFGTWGYISVVGFISVVILRREPFLLQEREVFYGTMYPQLGMMASAFLNSKCMLITDPLVCHRTQSQEEKAEAFAHKVSERAFMTDVQTRNAKYFGAPFIRMINYVVKTHGLSYEEVSNISEHTVINGRLVDFLVDNIVLAVQLGVEINHEDQIEINEFFNGVWLEHDQCKQLARYTFIHGPKFPEKKAPAHVTTVSVVTPSFNQVRYLWRCLDSVWDQGHFPIEHFVLDPGSTDGSLNTARYYKHVTLINEPDAGQGDAVAKGIRRSSGDIIAWLNSDDEYADSEVFSIVVEEFKSGADIVYGNGEYLDEDHSKLRDAYINKSPATLVDRFQHEVGIMQPATFFRRSIVDKVGVPSSDLEYCMDYEYWIRATKAGLRFQHVDKTLARAHYHLDNKTYGQRGQSYEQVCKMVWEQYGFTHHIWLSRYADYLAYGNDGVLSRDAPPGLPQPVRQEIYRKLLQRFNSSAIVLERLLQFKDRAGYGETLIEMIDQRCVPQHVAVAGLQEPKPDEIVTYTVGGRERRYLKSWREEARERANAFLARAIAARKSRVCVILCNGPSLNRSNWDLLNRVDVIGSNNLFLNRDITEKIDLYTCVNYRVAEQSSVEINTLEIPKVLPWWLSYCLVDENTCWVEAKGFPEFSTDIFKNMSWRHTVTFFNMHLAYGLGYEKVLLIGCDHHYVQPEGVREQEMIRSHEADINHFDPRYFRSKEWQAADVNEMERMYRLAKEAFEADGREIINCTVGGHLELFRRSTLEVELAEQRAPKLKSLLQNTEIGPFQRKDLIHLDETRAVHRLLAAKPGFMIDVGAHHGHACLPFLACGWKVLAFEPDPKNRAVLESRALHAGSIEIVSNAVSNRVGQRVSFYSSPESSGVSSLTPFTNGHEKTCEVETTTLANELKARNIRGVTFLKIDTEGHDLFVLQGFPWDTAHPDVVECEFEDMKSAHLGYRFDDLACFLVEKGYEVFVSEWHPIVRYGVRHDWRRLARYPCSLMDHEAWGNLIAIRNSSDIPLVVQSFRDELAACCRSKNADQTGLKRESVSDRSSLSASLERKYPRLTAIKLRSGAMLARTPICYRFARLVWRLFRRVAIKLGA